MVGVRKSGQGFNVVLLQLGIANPNYASAKWLSTGTGWKSEETRFC